MVELEQAIVERLREVIDPETGVDIVRMRLIEDLHVDGETGQVRYRFRPSSPLCPLAVHLALGIRDAVAGVPGVTEQEIEVAGYVGADELTDLLADSSHEVMRASTAQS
jgi:metal-sulfur cluster biosynthetic enzyme